MFFAFNEVARQLRRKNIFQVWVTCAQSGKKKDDVTNLIFKSRDVPAKRLHMQTDTGLAR